MRHEKNARGDVRIGAYARISASLRLYEFDRDDCHASTFVSGVCFLANDFAMKQRRRARSIARVRAQGATFFSKAGASRRKYGDNNCGMSARCARRCRSGPMRATFSERSPSAY